MVCLVIVSLGTCYSYPKSMLQISWSLFTISLSMESTLRCHELHLDCAGWSNIFDDGRLLIHPSFFMPDD